MKQRLKTGLIIICAAGVAWMLFMGYMNTRATAFAVYVSGSVDSVTFYRERDLLTPIAVIRTNGRDVLQVVQLRVALGYSLFWQMPPAQYYFIARRGAEEFQSPLICCQAGLTQRRQQLTIRDIDDWQQEDL
jgi:hypothetical protein